MKIRPVGADFFHGDGETDMKITVACRHFASAPYRRRTDIIPMSKQAASEFEIADSAHTSTRTTTLITLHVKMSGARIRRATGREQTDVCASRVASRTRHV